jgi:putative membrane protein
MIYVFATEVAMIPVSAYVVFSSDILYPTYEYAPRLIPGFSPADDQLIAGVIMKLVGMAVSMAVLSLCFFRWYRASQARPAA